MPVELTPGETDPSVWGKFILASGLADAVSRTATAPIDRLKTRLQVFVICKGLYPYCFEQTPILLAIKYVSIWSCKAVLIFLNSQNNICI